MRVRDLLGALATGVVLGLILVSASVHPDPDAQSAEQVVAHAGVPAGIHPGPRP